MKYSVTKFIKERMSWRNFIWLVFLSGLLALGLYLGLNPKFAFVNPPYDKMGHFTGFFVASLMLGLFFKNFTLGMLVAFACGFGLEAFQYFSTVRYFSQGDILANCSGAISAWIVAIVSIGMISWHKKRSA